MNLVKVEDKIINLDNVTNMTTGTNIVILHYLDGREEVFKGRDAQVLKYWLSYRVSDADRDYQLYLAGKRWSERDTAMYRAFCEYQKAGGELEPAEWIVAGEPIHD